MAVAISSDHITLNSLPTTSEVNHQMTWGIVSFLITVYYSVGWVNLVHRSYIPPSATLPLIGGGSRGNGIKNEPYTAPWVGKNGKGSLKLWCL